MMPAETERCWQLLPFLVAGAFFTEFLDGTAVATALPPMATDFNLKPVDLSIGVSSYLFTLAGLMPASGWAAERFGARKVFCLAIATFTLASIACGVSRGLVSFTVARIVQGAGGALMTPVGRLTVLRVTPRSNLIRVIAILTWPALVAPIIGPPLGGFITAFASWRWIFLINAPFGLIGIALAARLMPSEFGDTNLRLDVVGLIMTGCAILAILVPIELIGRQTVNWRLAAGITFAAAALVRAASRHLARHPSPIVNINGLKVKSFAIVAGGGTLYRIAMGSIPFLLPLLFQEACGLDAFHSGLLVLWLFAGNLAIKPAASSAIRRFGFRRTLIVSGLLAAASILSLASLDRATPNALTFLVLFVAGATRSVGLTALNTLAFAEVQPEDLTGTSTLFNMLQQMGFGLGVAIGAIALRLGMQWSSGAVGVVTTASFRIAFGIVSLVALSAVVDFLRLPENAGADAVARS